MVIVASKGAGYATLLIWVLGSLLFHIFLCLQECAVRVFFLYFSLSNMVFIFHGQVAPGVPFLSVAFCLFQAHLGHPWNPFRGKWHDIPCSVLVPYVPCEMFALISDGTPNRDIHCDNSTLAHDIAQLSSRGMASGQRVYLSTTVNKYWKPCDAGSCPRRLTCLWS